jgi:hypothetical protein
MGPSYIMRNKLSYFRPTNFRFKSHLQSTSLTTYAHLWPQLGTTAEVTGHHVQRVLLAGSRPRIQNAVQQVLWEQSAHELVWSELMNQVYLVATVHWGPKTEIGGLVCCLFLHIVLVEHNYTHSVHGVCACFHSAATELSGHWESLWSASLKLLYSLLWKRLVKPWRIHREGADPPLLGYTPRLVFAFTLDHSSKVSVSKATHFIRLKYYFYCTAIQIFF